MKTNKVDHPESGGYTFSVNKPIFQNKPPPGRGGASGILAGGKLVVFGGHYFAGNDKFEYLNETILFDAEKLVWYPVNCTGEIPGPRYGHTAHVLGSRMFIFGGKGPGEVVYKDVYFLDLLEWVWVPVNTISQQPPPRFFHASEVVGRKIVVHGGWDGSEIFNDLWIFNTDSFSWMQPRSAGFGPSPRYGHTINLTLDGRLIIFGGCGITDKGIPKYFDDIRQLDTDTMVWSRPKISGQSPTGRYGHSATVMSDHRLFFYGGWGKSGCQSKDLIDDSKAYTTAILDTKNMTWYVPRKLGHKEAKHVYNHTYCKCSDSSLFIFGGYDGRQSLFDFFVVNSDTDIIQN